MRQQGCLHFWRTSTSYGAARMRKHGSRVTQRSQPIANAVLRPGVHTAQVQHFQP
jgi:hypothetical protein